MQLFKEERGSVLVITALLMFILLGVTALTVDGGYLYFWHTRLQDIADSAALAAAAKAVNTNGNISSQENQATLEAINYGKLNELDLNNSGLINGTADQGMEVNFETYTVKNKELIDKVIVNIDIKKEVFFARVFGVDDTPVSVSATVQIGPSKTQTGGLVPLTLIMPEGTEYVFGEEIKLNFVTNENVSGNFGYLDFDDPSKFGYYLENGYNGTLQVGQIVSTNPGGSVGIVEPAIQGRIDACDTCVAETVLTQHPDCPRLVTVPIIESFDVNGKTEVIIQGFATLFLFNKFDAENNKEIWGQFIKELSTDPYENEEDQTSPRAIRLIK